MTKIVALLWILYHCGLEGNENAGFLAKKGITIQQRFHSEISYYSTILLIKKNYKRTIFNDIKKVTENKFWCEILNTSNKNLIPNSPRR